MCKIYKNLDTHNFFIYGWLCNVNKWFALSNCVLVVVEVNHFNTFKTYKI